MYLPRRPPFNSTSLLPPGVVMKRVRSFQPGRRTLGISAFCLALATHPCMGQAGPLRADRVSTQQERQDEAQTAFAKGDFRGALQVFQALAREGDGPSQMILAMMMRLGWETPQDLVASSAWGELAQGACGPAQNAAMVTMVKPVAERGEPKAQSMMGMLVADGSVVDLKPDASVAWFKAAAAQGEPYALWAYGRALEEGHGVPKNPEEARRMYGLAWEKGSTFAAHRLGTIFFRGNNVKRDIPEGIRWYKLAAEHGDAIAAYQLGWIYTNKQGVPKDLAEGFKWNLQSARRGYPSAQIHVGDAYRDGSGLAKDPVEAFKWFALATYNGRTLERIEYFNYALDEFQQAGKRLDRETQSKALIALAHRCRDGDGVPQDLVAAMLFLRLPEIQVTDALEKEKEALQARLTPYELTRVSTRLNHWPSFKR